MDSLLSSNSRLRKLFLTNNTIKIAYWNRKFNSALEYVHMEKNHLYSFGTLLRLKSLTHLYFKNGFGSIGICLFSNEDSNLRVLSLKNCNLNDLQSFCSMVYPLKFLTTLDASHNKLRASSLTYNLLPSLQNKSLSHNSLYSVPENLANFTTLKVLSLSYCRFCNKQFSQTETIL